jgi:hypothetical protein
LIVFVRAPRLGRVKTRLAADLGAAEALNAYHLLVQTLIGRIRAKRHVQLRYTPDDAGDEIQPWLKPGWEARPQGGGDLGVRMGRAFLEVLGGGVRRVIIIGSDCPQLTAADLATAWRALDRHELVLGPALDGGYWLIALKSWQPILFQGIDWSTDRVLEQTLKRATAAHLRVSRLRLLEDIDTGEQWLRFRKQQRLGRAGPRIREGPDFQ